MVFGALKHYQVRGKKEELVTEMEKVVKQNKNQESLLSWDFRGKKKSQITEWSPVSNVTEKVQLL